MRQSGPYSTVKTGGAANLNAIERDAKTGAVREFLDWRYVEQEGWSGVVRQKNGVCFMAALRGREKELTPYISKAKK